jgi:betaine-aldehyde dehydrogenase
LTASRLAGQPAHPCRRTTGSSHGLDIARRVRTGTYTVNGLMMDFAGPFGGFKCSGIGRELGPEGLEAYLEPKQINLPMGYEVR